MTYENLFKRGSIGNIDIKNRVVMPAMGTFLNLANGEISDHTIAYFEARAKGGVGLIITEFTAVVDRQGNSGITHPRVDDIVYIPMLGRLADAVHKHGTRIFMQLSHGGRQTTPDMTGGLQPVAPSAIPCPLSGVMPRELSTEEVKGLVAKFIFGAVICKRAGMDGVELHGAHGYLINQFLSPLSNLRTDEYGGSFENRMRFLQEIVHGIKRECGDQFAISVRLSVDEFLEGGIDLPTGVAIARHLESIGVDAINVSCANYARFETIIEPVTFEQGWRAYLAEAVKKEVNVPVIAVGVIREPAFADALIEAGKTDFVALGRGLIADPNWCTKAAGGRDAEIRRCISCLYCIDMVMAGVHLGCAVNARAGREIELGELNENGGGRKVVVVGGGPGGMEAARILAKRGFKVVLFEKTASLGGQLNLGCKPPGKAKMSWLVEYLTHQLELLKVDLRLGVEADESSLKAENPYAVFIATGAVAAMPPIEGIDNANVCAVHDILAGDVAVEGSNVAIIGAGMTGCETARLLAGKGNRVFLVEMLPGIATGAGIVDKLDISARMREETITILTDHRLLGITEKAIVVKDMNADRQYDIAVDQVVLSLGMKSRRDLYDRIRTTTENVFLLGDAVSPRRIGNAVKEGFEKAFTLS